MPTSTSTRGAIVVGFETIARRIVVMVTFLIDLLYAGLAPVLHFLLQLGAAPRIDRVRLHGIHARAELNGALVRLGAWNEERERWQIAHAERTLLLRTENVHALSDNEPEAIASRDELYMGNS